MPPPLLYDLSGIDLNRVLFDQEAIRQANPQRGDMEQLNAIVYAEPELGRIVGYKDVRDNEFWVAGHIPGRPLFPGVLMIEAGAQLASFYTRKYAGWKGFIGALDLLETDDIGNGLLQPGDRSVEARLPRVHIPGRELHFCRQAPANGLDIFTSFTSKIRIWSGGMTPWPAPAWP